MIFKTLISIVIFIFNSVLSETTPSPNYIIKLNSNWIITNKNLNITISNVELPISVTTALRKENLIPDPLYRYNDVYLRWIVQDDNWVFTNNFNIDNFAQLNDSSSIDIIFESIDTIASVYLNDKFILAGNNQFLKYHVKNLNSKLTNGVNTLAVKFASPINQAKMLASTYPYYVPNNCTPDVQHGECHVNFLRKEQCSFSWDWGPAFAPIYLGPVSLDIISSFDFSFHLTTYPHQMNDLENWIIDLTIDINPFIDLSKNSNIGQIVVKIDEIEFQYMQSFQLTPSQSSFNLKMDLSATEYKAELWWPLGYGSQKLYNLTCEVILNNQSSMKSKLIGLRSVELVQDQIDPKIDGLTFYFRINNVNTYLKGSNWIPADSFQELITPKYLEWLMRSARDANINILRVWGGGVYEQDYFYELADQYGVMIWQDFMFACNFYPTNLDFLANVNDEIVYQVNRLKNHPSIVVWSANNENEAALSTDWYHISYDKELYAEDYRKLYIDVVMQNILLNDPEMSRPFLSSSPTNGKETISENWIARNPYDARFGDLHFYNYNANGWDPNAFPVARLMSEFGVQSLPSFASLSDVYQMPDDADIFGDLNNHRQHHGDGNQEIVQQIQKYMKLPNLTDKVDQFKAIIYLSQIYQAMTLRTGSELYRRKRDEYDPSSGTGLCSGSMYWQFNDLWQAPTWSSIEYVSSPTNNNFYGGKWKMAHYFIKRSYAPLLLSAMINSPYVSIYALSDLQQNYTSNFSLKIYSYDSLIPLYDENFKFSIGALSSKPILAISFDELKSISNCTIESNNSCILIMQSTDPQIQSNFMFLNNRLVDLTNLKTPILTIADVKSLNSTSSNNNVFSIQLKTNTPALFVWLDLETSKFTGTFSDNGFHMFETSKTITYQTDNLLVDLDEIKKYLSVKSYMNIYE